MIGRLRGCWLVLVAALLLTTLSATGAAAATAGVPPAQDPVTTDQCRTAYATGTARAGSPWLKNRFSGCYRTKYDYSQYTCDEPACPVLFVVHAVVYTTVTMAPDDRKVLVTHFVDLGAGPDAAPPDMRLGVKFSCAGKGLAGSTAACDVPLARVSKTLAEWRADPVVAQEYLPQGEDPENQAPMPYSVPEKQTYYNFDVGAYAENQPPGRNSVSTAGATFNVRCDVARQLNPQYVGGSDCVFFGLFPTFTLDRQDVQVAEYAGLIRAAMTNLPSTYPGTSPQKVPGNKGVTPPVTRRFYSSEVLERHRQAAEQACAEHWGPDYRIRPEGGTNDCAVYPFSTLYEGASSVSTRRFAVQPVPSAQFTTVLARLDQYVVENHILDFDQYWVQVVN